jgi:hypothetical protein
LVLHAWLLTLFPLVPLLLLRLLIIIVLPWIRNLVLQHLNELVKHDREDCTNRRPRPVDPVLLVEGTCDDARPEAARGIERATCVVHADELGDEEREADADGGDEGCYMLRQYNIQKVRELRR